ncbi:glycoside hydrolase family 18 protein [Frateuria hangzhouensis]|uniref:glycoside hydrolase family 18 protein n=1 Tax=Frateuria hangzhouensis TaxID=2995589 RepID=UPI002260DBA6|nr:glycoside hydrolase family 18 protein [Frateuria sp. STR12]MCX7515135.1 glycoside hydrolase family 18 protein [Frateuria sp. STR12]
MALRLPKFVLALLACTLVAAASTAQAADYRVVGYATDWKAVHVRTLERIDTLIFAFARVENGRVVLDADAGPRLQRLLALKRTKPSLKVMIAVGGWGAGGFSEAAATAEGREAFARSAARLVAEHGADGLDVDWEYPGHGESGIASSPADRTRFPLLLEALRQALDAAAGEGRHYALSVAVADGPFADGVDIAAVAPWVDWFNLMTYDFVNRMTPTTGHHTGLYWSRLAPADARSADGAVRQYLAAGVPPGKLLLGAAFYGREFAGVKADHDGLYQHYDRYEGEHPWPQLVRDYIDRNGFERHWDAQAKASWLWNPRTRRFVTYDDPRSIAAKAAYVKAHRLGGMMYWEQAHDPEGALVDAIWEGLQ